MAFQARLGALTNELVEATTGISSKEDQQRFARYREDTFRTLRHHSFLRTNQFEVSSRLDGLVERFRVQYREGLGDALSQRLDALSKHPSKWHPDILHFLLEVADQPYQKTRLEDLEALRPPEEEKPPALKWEDIGKEDGWDDDPDLWKTIDYGRRSDDDSDEETYHDVTAEMSDSEASSIAAAQYGRRPEDVVVGQDEKSALEKVVESQSWRSTPAKVSSDGRARKVAVTEFQIIREVLFMLQGLETSLFDENLAPVSTYQLATASWDAFKAAITSFAESGRMLGILRSFAERSQSSPHLRVFRDCIQSSLRDWDKVVSSVESRLVAAHDDLVVSLIAIQYELRPHLQPLQHLSSIVQRLVETANLGTFRYLELLFDEVGITQLAGDMRSYEFLGNMFFTCFQVYLRPIRQWMEDGQLIPGDKIFFVSETAAKVPLSQIWQNQYKLRRHPDGSLHAPRFLQPSASKIFTAGKSIVVLKHLGQYEAARARWSWKEPQLDFVSVRDQGRELAPFAELFDVAFEEWIQSKHQATSETLKELLFKSCGLWPALDALESIYFMADGSVADLFAHDVFTKLDTLKPNWHDRYALGGLAQEAFSGRLDTFPLSAAVTPRGQQCPVQQARDSVKTALPEIRITYRLSWPAQLMLLDENIAGYQQVFTLLLQLRRAAYPLHKKSLRLDSQRDGAPEDGQYHLLRTRLLWLVNTLRTYLSTLVLAPASRDIRTQLRQAGDVDAMIALHSAFMRRVLDEACLGGKLDPIREAILDLLDLSLRLDQAESANAAKEAEEVQELSRLSLMSSPMKQLGTPRKKQVQRYVDDSDEEDGAPMRGSSKTNGEDRPYGDVLAGLTAEFEKGLRFVVGGLRGVARASSEGAAARWDLLAEMLETGLRG